MSSEEIKPVNVTELKTLVDGLNDSELNELSSFITRKLNQDFGKKIAILPNLANNEYKVFDERDVVSKITPKVLEIRKRRYMAFVYLYANPYRTDDQVIEYIRILEPALSYVQAARDLNAVKNVMGNSVRTQKELIRYQVIEMLKNSYHKAEMEGYIDGMISASNGITNAANLKHDTIEIPWDQMITPSWEPVNNLEALGDGFEHKESLEKDIERLKKKYGSNIEDAEII